jgi:Mg-chelatase subunit ChlD
MIDMVRTNSMVVTPSFGQLGIFILDGSGSMQEIAAGGVTKAQAVSQAIRDVFTVFRKSTLRRNFSFAVVTFDHRSQLHTGVTGAENLDDNADYDPLAHHGGGTDIATGLATGQRLAEDFLRQTQPTMPRSVVLVVMSDGRDGDGGAGDPAATRRLADALKSNPRIKICTSYFPGISAPDRPAEEHLKGLSSDPTNDYTQVHDAQALRDFFLRSASSGVTV